MSNPDRQLSTLDNSLNWRERRSSTNYQAPRETVGSTLSGASRSRQHCEPIQILYTVRHLASPTVASGESALITDSISPHDFASGGQPTIIVVDDDESMRRALADLFETVGLRVEVFGSVPELLRSGLPDVPSCLVLDVRLPELSGLDFQKELAERNIHIPIVFMTAHGDIPMSVLAMKAGAIDFLSKPFRQQEMLHAVTVAIGRDRKRRKDEKLVQDARLLFNTLTPREREVLSLVAVGLMNKQIAAELGIAEITVKIHRGHMMRKLGAKSLAELVRINEILGRRLPAARDDGTTSF
jgi:FixJ family two-component response regulator